MLAVLADPPGGPEALKILDVAAPTPAPGEVLIEVVAAGVNRADLLQRQGHYPPPAGITEVLGLECSGRIAALGDGVDGFSVGQDVCALLAGGGYAEFVAVPAGQVAPVPSGMDLVTAAGLMETTATVWSNLVMVAAFGPGQKLLVHGGSSGIGTTAIQVAKAIGASVAVTVGSADKAAFCRELGADLVINYRDEDFADAVAAADMRPDVILDIIGAKYLSANVKALARGGRIVTIGLQGGVKGELNLGALLSKNASITATSLRLRSVEEKSHIVSELIAQVWPMVEQRAVWPVVHSTFSIDDVAQAHRLLETSSHRGKVVLTLDSSAGSTSLEE